jgi:putative oxidoreductase
MDIRTRQIDDRLASYGTLAPRLGLGTDFVAHALDKLLLISLPGIVEFFEAHGFPGWTAYPGLW